MKLSLLLLSIVLLCSPIFAGEDSPAPVQSPRVVVGKVDMVNNIEIRRYTGHVVSAAEVQLLPRVSGELLRVLFKEGEMVEEGQLLYELDPVRYEAAVRMAEAEIKEAEARVTYAEITYERFAELHAKKATTKDSRDSAESDFLASQAALLIAEARLITAQDDLKNTKIIAPIRGKIGTTKYTKGNYLTPSSGVIATIVQVNPVRVTFSISTRDFLTMFGSERELREKAAIHLKLADETVYSKKGMVEYIENQVNARTDTMKIIVKFENPDGVLVPGNSLQVMLTHSDGSKLPAVVPSAVMHDSSMAYVYVVDDQKCIERRKVELGPSTSSQQIIKSGLNPGELIVIDGTHKASPGMTIRYDFAG